MVVKESEVCGGGLEWRINFPDGTSKILVPHHHTISKTRFCRILHAFFVEGLFSKIYGFFREAWRLGMDDPKKFFHCFKVGIALSLVSLFYYMRPLYQGVGGNAMWAVLTVVVVFEYTVGATLCKCLNKATATFLAGALGIGVHWIGSHFGEKLQPIFLQGSVFVLAAAATFTRFMPSVKARFDYGVLIFILTFSLVSVSGFRVGKLFEFASHRLSTIAIGTSICILTSILFCPVWAGEELHNLIQTNMEKLADSLDECVAEYFRKDARSEASNKISVGYRCVLNSRATEESLANFARWEPAHGGFNFGHPWKEYRKVGASLRSCAYHIEVLNGSINAGTKAPDFLKKHFSKFCMKLSSSSSAVLKELVFVTHTMTRSAKIDIIVEEMRSAVEELQIVLKSLITQPINASTNINIGNEESDASNTSMSLIEIAPLVTLSSLLIEIAARTEDIAKAVNELAN
ncbi:PREDICTED: aluminum-activated malate transporter 10-like [Erythranthe guttata]|uniref:aluminum-activated malate transporter 10-like n=1 Tax=Erythranthe guttata TaxID=4155 RepID=UPI00064E0EF7|nr:PREDICTED: aluminum-activated malate transporter 10-like [Erythranthe guttata]|eukprot:XP_012835628.1 PREDICTED: aluminum-activated malate transporter 10-like [Erythranthe guttata]